MNLLRSGLRGVILLYKYGVSPVLPGGCRFHPSCSSYALEAVDRLGAGRGGALAMRRILRCHPWGGSGFDPVPERREPSDRPAPSSTLTR